MTRWREAGRGRGPHSYPLPFFTPMKEVASPQPTREIPSLYIPKAIGDWTPYISEDHELRRQLSTAQKRALPRPPKMNYPVAIKRRAKRKLR